jgi:hypothetical protein
MRWKVLLWLGIAACISPAADSAATFDASLSLAAREAAGVSASAKPLVVTIAARGTGGGPAVFAPYIDMGLAASGNLLTIQRDSQIKGIHSGLCRQPGRLFRRLAGSWLDYQRHAAERPHDPLARAVAARGGR